MLPAFILLLSSGLAARTRCFRQLSLAGVVLLSTANLYGAGQLVIHGDYFSNGPDHQIQAMIRSLGADKVAIIHDGEIQRAWNVYTAVRYSFGSAVPQYAYQDSGSKGVRVVDYPERRAEADPVSLSPQYLIVIHSAELNSAEIVDQLRRGIRPIAEGPVARSLVASTRWVPVEEKMIVAYIAAKITLLQRARSGLGSHAADARPWIRASSRATHDTTPRTVWASCRRIPAGDISAPGSTR